MNTYIAIFNRKEIQFQADSQWDAVQLARIEMKIPKSKVGLLSVVPLAKDDNPCSSQYGFFISRWYNGY